MSGGKSNTTNVTNTGLGDQQFNALNAGISSAAGILTGTNATINNQVGSLSRQVGDGMASTTGQIKSLGNAQNAGFAAVGNQINGTGAALSGQIGETSKALGGQIGTVGQQVSGVSGQVGAVGQQVSGVGERVGQVGQQVGAVGQLVGAVGDQVGAARNDLATGFAATGDQLSGLSGQVGSVGQQVGGVGQQVGAARNDLATGFAQTGSQLTGLTGQVGQVGQQLGEQLTGVGQQVGAARTDLATGFADTGAKLTGLSGQVGQVGTAVGNLNDGMVAGFDYTNDNLDARTNAIYANQNEGFTKLSDLVGTGFTANSAQMTDYQKNIMLGQGKLNDALTAASKKQDNYYTGLAAGQDGILGAVGGVQTGLNDFTAQYTKDAAQDLTDRRSLMTGVTNSTAMIRNDIGRTADATQRSLTQAVRGVAPEVAASVAPQGGTRPAAVGGFLEPGPNEMAQMANSLNNARSILTTMGDRLDPAIRSQYTELVSAFDARGTLIPQGIDQGGAFVSRMMDGDTNLVVNKFNGSGQPLGRTGFNVNQMLAAADSFGANAQPASMGLMG